MDLKRFIQDYTEQVYHAGDAEAAGRFIADPCIHHEHGHRVVMTLAENKKRIAGFFAQFRDARFTYIAELADGDLYSAAYQCEFTGPAGERQTFSGIEIFDRGRQRSPRPGTPPPARAPGDDLPPHHAQPRRHAAEFAGPGLRTHGGGAQGRPRGRDRGRAGHRALWFQAAIRPFQALGLDVPAIASAGADVRAAGGSVVEQRMLDGEFATFLAELCDRAGWARHAFDARTRLPPRRRAARVGGERPRVAQAGHIAPRRTPRARPLGARRSLNRERALAPP